MRDSLGFDDAERVNSTYDLRAKAPTGLIL